MKDATPTESAPRRTLALGSLALALLGLALLGYDVVTETQRSIGWLPLVAGALGLVAAATWGALADARGREPTVPLCAPPAERGAGDGPSGEGTPAAPPPRLYPERRWLAWIAAGALAALLVQALVPLRYYLGDDLYDERFSWRMFSAVRMHECDLRASETVSGAERPVRLMQTIHAGWVTTLQRNREAVMERYLRWRCAHEGVERARLVNQCASPEGRPVPPIVREIDCASGEITREEREP